MGETPRRTGRISEFQNGHYFMYVTEWDETDEAGEFQPLCYLLADQTMISAVIVFFDKNLFFQGDGLLAKNCFRIEVVPRVQIKEQQSELKKYQPSGPAATKARCPHCGSPVVGGAAFCQTCGGRIVEESAPPPVLYCVQCGSDLRESAQFCPKCGQAVER